jgi:ParB family chromosome partitioning protein
MLSLGQISPDRQQPRKTFDEEALQELADSIAEHGLLQPIVVRPAEDGGGYRIVAGERRWRASRLAGLKEVPVIVKEVSAGAAMEMALVENLQRADLRPMEAARGYQALMDTYGLTQEEAARRVGKSRPSVANALRLLHLAPLVAAKLDEGILSEGHAKVLLSAVNGAVQEEAAKQIEAQGLSVRQTEQLLRILNLRQTAAEGQKTKKKPAGSTFAKEAELALREVLGTRVTVEYNSQNGKGHVRIPYTGMEELQHLARLLGKKK